MSKARTHSFVRPGAPLSLSFVTQAALFLGLAVTITSSTARGQESAVASLRASATDPAGNLALGRALRRAGHYPEAAVALRAAARGASPNRADAQYELARVFMDQGDFRAAQTACNALPASGLASARRHACLARAHLVWQRSGLAEREVLAARAAAPNDPELSLLFADTLRVAGRIQEAEQAFRIAQTSLPASAEPSIGLATLLETLQRFDDAEAAWRRAAQLDANDPLVNFGLGRFLLRRRHNAREALPLLQRANSDRPDWPEALVALGEAQLATEANAEALATFDRAAARNANLPGVQSGLGRARLRANRLPESETALRLAVQQVPNDVEAHAALAELLGRTQRGEDAVAMWDRAMDLAPQDNTIRLHAAEHAHSIGQEALARALLERALTDAPRSAPILFLRAEVAWNENDRPTARRFYQQALEGEGSIDRARVEARIQEIDNPRPQRRR